MMDEKEKQNKPSFSRRLACENSKFQVFLDDVEAPDGQQVNDYLVIKPRVRVAGEVTGIAVMPVVEGQVGLLRLYRHAIQDMVWEIPRGFIDAGESGRTAAMRELEEETGLVCRDGDLVSCGHILPEAGVLDARIHVFAALRCLRGRPFSNDEFGHREFRLFGHSDLRSMVDNGLIQDPSTLVACIKYLNSGQE